VGGCEAEILLPQQHTRGGLAEGKAACQLGARYMNVDGTENEGVKQIGKRTGEGSKAQSNAKPQNSQTHTQTKENVAPIGMTLKVAR